MNKLYSIWALVSMNLSMIRLTTRTRRFGPHITATDALAADPASAKENGRSKVKNEFMDERVYSKTKSLNDRVPRSKRKNFSTQELAGGTVGEFLKGKTEEI